MFTKLSILILICSLFVSCSKSRNINFEDGSISIVNPPFANLFESVEITSIGTEGVKSAVWRFYDNSGELIDPNPCDKAFTVGPINCAFDTAGSIKVKLEVTNSKNKVLSAKSSIDIIDLAKIRDQSPKIELEISDINTNTVIAKVATFKEKEYGSTVFRIGQNLKFDFSKTTDDADSPQNLKYEIDFGNGYTNVGISFIRSFEVSNAFPVRIRVTDSEGNSSIKSFLVFIKCNDENYVDMEFDMDSFIVSRDGTFFQYYNYDITNFIKLNTGKPPFKFKLDYNGDNIRDPNHYANAIGSLHEDWIVQSSWGSPKTIRAYSIYGGERTLSLTVWDSCNNMISVEVERELPMPEAKTAFWGYPTVQVPHGSQLGGNYEYFGADISGLSGNNTKSANGEVLISQAPTDATQKRVRCEYWKSQGSYWASVTIVGDNQYISQSGTGVRHGFELGIYRVFDPDVASGEPPVWQPPYIGRAYFRTDGAYDDLPSVIYSKYGDCNLALNIQKLPLGSGNCGVPGKGEAFSIIIDGSFECPIMQTSDRLSLTARNGTFYCTVARVDMCPPSGGGGGSGLPPKPE